ncbi:hypothetical protein K432DRAFT_447191 [Lepidopterella palustris CBS 459.81]|uniref:Uncharacterized protein n=1 Tax=Lepidopterella palustris CBS 459.81 TaxID=1314670 RepID=A0A8E2DZJ0_9PEZI|nr:hypothetical protein K432DRAFT_447191 [Lepidopterella palustris CBS 459.81]
MATHTFLGSKYLGNLFAGKPHFRVLILGDGGSGKTTFLYMLKLGYKVSTIPTMGFNVETIDRGKASVTFWDVGGCDKIRPLLRHYFENTQALLFFHDVSLAQSEMDQSFDWLVSHVNDFLRLEDKHVHVFAVLTKQDLLPDDKREEIVKRESNRVEAWLLGKSISGEINYKVFDTLGFNVLEDRFIWNIYDEMTAIMVGKTQATAPSTIEASNTQKRPTKAELIQRIKQDRKEDIGSAEAFWTAFTSAKLQTWNHRNHLRAGYIILLHCLRRFESVYEAADLFMEHLERLRESEPNRFRNTAHRTMTIFWLYQLRTAILSYKAAKELSTLPSSEDFPAVVLHAPELMDGQLWSDYYTKDILFTPAAKENWVLPNLQPVLSNPALRSLASQAPTNSTETQMDKVQDRLIVFALSVVKRYISTGTRRGLVVKEALWSLQSTTMRQRSQGKPIPSYSETQAYFWIQIVDAACATLRNASISQSSPSSSTLFDEKTQTFTMPSLERINVQTLTALFDVDASLWRKYYSPTLWNSMEARMQFQNPDITPLPNIIPVPSSTSLDNAVRSWLSTPISTLPGLEDLQFQAKLISKEAELIETPFSNTISSHAQLLFNIYARVLTTYTQKTNGRPNTSSLSAAITELNGPAVKGVTSKTFWVQQVLTAYLHGQRDQTNSAPIIPKVAAHESLDNDTTILLEEFQRFLLSNTHLAYADLPFRYYSPEVWHSWDAENGTAAPDRRPMPRFWEDVRDWDLKDDMW